MANTQKHLIQLTVLLLMPNIVCKQNKTSGLIFSGEDDSHCRQESFSVR